MDSITIVTDTLAKVVQTITRSNTSETAKSICCNYLLVLLIILFAGIVGGIINYLSIEQSSKDGGEKKSILKDRQFYLQLLLGICGAALIPLLLNLTSSKLFEKCDDCFFVYFVFCGYCLIGAIFSRSLLDSIAKRLDIEKIKKDVEIVKGETSKVKGIAGEAEKYIESKLAEEQQEADTEQQKKVETKATTIKAKIEKTDSFTDTDLNKYVEEKAFYHAEIILNDLQKSKYRDRSIQGISKTTKIPEDKVNLILRAFKKAEIVIEVKWYGKVYYRLTPQGKETEIVE
jgi:hypothetical protein